MPSKPPEYVPFIALHKSRFAYGEPVFWGIILRAADGNRDPVSENLWDTGRAVVTRPDGSLKDEPVSWVKEVRGDGVWQGRCELTEIATPGLYSLVFEFAGRPMEPTTFSVERTDLLDLVRREFVFSASPRLNDVDVTLTVTNGCKETLRFPYRGSNGFISVSLKGQNKSIGTFYPWKKYPDPPATSAPRFSFNRLTWDIVQKAQLVTLLPGETYLQALSLQEAVSEVRGVNSILTAGYYDVTFGTTLETLISEPDGDYAAMSPVRLAVKTTARCFVADP